MTLLEATNMTSNGEQHNGWEDVEQVDFNSTDMLDGSGNMTESMQDKNEEKDNTTSSVGHGGAYAASGPSPDATDTGAGTGALEPPGPRAQVSSVRGR
jgi:hypothetical protein